MATFLCETAEYHERIGGGEAKERTRAILQLLHEGCEKSLCVVMEVKYSVSLGERQRHRDSGDFLCHIHGYRTREKHIKIERYRVRD